MKIELLYIARFLCYNTKNIKLGGGIMVDYKLLKQQIMGLVEIDRNYISVFANVSSLLFHGLENINWAGFYLVRNNRLYVGPFNGKPACVIIDCGKGVCGTCLESMRPLIVNDVHQFVGHIACDSASNSELVIPLILDNRVVAVLDIDSFEFNNFSQYDLDMLLDIMQNLVSELDFG